MRIGKKYHTMCPGGLISPILHSHYPKSSSFFLDSSHSHFPCSQEMISPYRLQEKNEAFSGIPLISYLSSLLLPSLQSKEGVALSKL